MGGVLIYGVTLINKLEEIIKPICLKHNVGLYDIEFINTQNGKVLCVYITKVGGISITDCTKVSKDLNEALDNDESLIDVPYTLEVSSPGVERPLKYKKHYISAINESIKITFMNDDKKETLVGKLIEVNQDYVLVDEVKIEFHDIKKAKTVFIKQ